MRAGGVGLVHESPDPALRAADFCPNCRYDVRADDDRMTRCPECGGRSDLAAVRAAEAKLNARLAVGVVTVLLSVGAVPVLIHRQTLLFSGCLAAGAAVLGLTLALVAWVHRVVARTWPIRDIDSDAFREWVAWLTAVVLTFGVAMLVAIGVFVDRG